MRITINITRPNLGNIVAKAKDSVVSAKTGVSNKVTDRKAYVESKIADYRSNKIEFRSARLDSLYAELSIALNQEDDARFAQIEDEIAKAYRKLAKVS